MLPVVIYITNGTFTDWGTALNNSNRGFTRLVLVTFLIILVDHFELDSIYFKKCTNAMTMGTSSSIMYIILNHAQLFMKSKLHYYQ